MRTRIPFLIFWMFVTQQGFTAEAAFSSQAFFDSNLKKVESALQEKHIHYDRSNESIRFLDPDKSSETYGLTVEVFGNLTSRFSGSGKSGWTTLENKGGEINLHAFTNNDPVIDDFLLKRTRNFEVITGFRMAVGTGKKIVGAYMFESYRPTSPASAELTGGLLVSLYQDGTHGVELESAEALKAFNKTEQQMVQQSIGALIGSQSIRSTTQHIIEGRDLGFKQGNYSWMK